MRARRASTTDSRTPAGRNSPHSTTWKVTSVTSPSSSTAAAIEDICRPMLEAGKAVMVLSAGALLPRPHLMELAREKGGQIIVPTGALLGLDAVTAAAEGKINSVRMTTRKPPKGLIGAPHLVANNISVDGLNAPKLVFSGNAREAAAGFPAKNWKDYGDIGFGCPEEAPCPPPGRYLSRAGQVPMAAVRVMNLQVFSQTKVGGRNLGYHAALPGLIRPGSTREPLGVGVSTYA